jgi:V-type H+-transporting ATPase subunit a
MSENEEIKMFRSEAMEYMQFVLPREAAYQTTYEIGRLGAVHFRDMNSHINANKREFFGEIRRCDELMRVLRFFRNQLDKNDIVPLEDDAEKTYNFSDLEARFDEVY